MPDCFRRTHSFASAILIDDAIDQILKESLFIVQAHNLDKWQGNAPQVSGMLKAIGNERRLLVLCQLAAHGEMSVGALVKAVGLSQSALSQHLARMRAEKVVTARRDGQTIYYSIADSKVEAVMARLYELYCAEPVSS